MGAGTLMKGADTLADRAATVLEGDILIGRLPPGGRLGIIELSQLYGIGPTPLREGMSRLVARGLVLAVGQRGFRVAEVSLADLQDITRVRQLVETDALQRSTVQGDDAWEAGIVASLHRLARFVERHPASFGEGSAEFDRLHKSFHTSLIAACGSPRLLDLHSLLYDQAYRYRRVMMARHTDAAAFVALHSSLAGMVVGRDPDAAAALHAHLQSTIGYLFPEHAAP